MSADGQYDVILKIDQATKGTQSARVDANRVSQEIKATNFVLSQELDLKVFRSKMYGYPHMP